MDLAELGLQFSQTGAEATVSAMDKVTKGAGQAEDAVDSLAASQAKGAKTAVTAGSQHATAAQNVARFGQSSFQAQMQVMELEHVVRSMTDSIVAGRSPVQALTLEMGRLTQIAAGPGGLGGALSTLGGTASKLLGFINPITAAIGAVVVVTTSLAAAFIAGQKDANNFNNAMKATSEYAGLTGAAYEDMVAKVAGTADAGFGKARTTLLALASSGEFTGRTIGILGQDVVMLAQLTGQSTEKVIAYYLTMDKGVGDFAVNFEKRYHSLDEAQIEYIRQLEDTGQTTQAQLAAAIAIHDALGKQGPASLGYLEQAWNGVTKAIGGAWAAMKQIGNVDLSRMTQIAELQGKIAKAQSDPAAQNPGANFMVSGWKDQLAKLQAEQAAADAKTKAQAEQAEVQTRGVAAAEDLRNLSVSIADNSQKAANAISKYRADIEALRKANPNSPLIPSAAQQATTEHDIRKKYMPAAYKKPKQGPKDDIGERSASVDQSMAAAQDAALKAQLGLTTEIEQRADIERAIAVQASLERQAAIDRQIAEIQGDKGISEADKQRLVAQLNIVKLIDKETAAKQQAKADQDEESAIQKRKLQMLEADNDNTQERLRLAASLATTDQERQQIALKLLDAADDRLKAELAAVIASKTSTQAEIDIAKAKLAQLNATRGDRVSAVGDRRGAEAAGTIVANIQKNSPADQLKVYQDTYAEIDRLRRTDQINEQQAAQAKAMADANYNQVRLQNASNFFGELAGLTSSSNRTLKDIGKAAAIAQATIDAYAAINKQLGMGNVAMAVAIGLEAFANVARIEAMADGGPVVGSGGPRDDKNLRRLSNGEYVVNAASAAKARPWLDALNFGTRPTGSGSGYTMQPAPQIIMMRPAANDSAATTEFHYHGTSQPTVKQSKTANGGTRYDVYQAVIKPALKSAGANGDLRRFAGMPNPPTKRGS